MIGGELSSRTDTVHWSRLNGELSTQKTPERGATLAISKRLRHEIFRRDNFTCQGCGAKAPDVKLQPDHVIPTTLGGTDDPSNLQTLCEDCNAGKSATPPDAATVAKVAADAGRWAQAMEAAADQMLGGVKDRDEARAAFDSKWREWSEGRPPLPRPMGWEMSVDQFLKAGLPLSILLDCVDIAMRARHVKADGLFKYMCAIAWKRVSELQAAARAAVADTAIEEGEPEPNDFQDGQYDLAAELLEELDDEETIERFRRDAQEYSDHPEDPIECEIAAARFAFSQFRYDCGRLLTAAEHLLTFIPEDLVSSCREYTVDDFRARTGEEPGEVDLVVHTVREMLRRRKFREASTYLDSLPSAEKDEWIACATTVLGASDDPSHQIDIDIKAAAYAQKVKAGGPPPKGMCTGNGQHGATCPAKAQYRMRLQECPGCPEECAGHRVCEPHLERVMDGLIVSRSTDKPLALLDFEEIPPPDPWEVPF